MSVQDLVIAIVAVVCFLGMVGVLIVGVFGPEDD